MKLSALSCFLFLSSLVFAAAVNVSLSGTAGGSGNSLQGASGDVVTEGRLAVLVVDTNGDGVAPSLGTIAANDFFDGTDDYIAAFLQTSDVFGSAVVEFSSVNVNSTAVNAGDSFYIVWFPSHSSAIRNLFAGDPYGVTRASDGINPWVIPTDGGSLVSSSAPGGLASLTVAGDDGSSGGGNGSGGGTTFSLDSLLSGTDVGGGARFSSWFGFYFPIGDTERWHFHNDLGWIYPIGEDGASMWYWDIETADFWWTGDGTYPFTFRSGNGTWYFFLTRTEDGSRWFSNQSTGNSEVLGNILQ